MADEKITPPSAPMTVIRFTRHYQFYNSGETAGFPPHVAGPIIKAGYAEFVSGPVPTGTVDKRNPPPGQPAESVPADGSKRQPDERREKVKQSTLNQSAENAVELVKGVENTDDLEAMREGEIAHPNYPGGRKTVLEAIDRKIRDVQEQQEQ